MFVSIAWQLDCLLLLLLQHSVSCEFPLRWQISKVFFIYGMLYSQTGFVTFVSDRRVSSRFPDGWKKPTLTVCRRWDTDHGISQEQTTNAVFFCLFKNTNNGVSHHLNKLPNVMERLLFSVKCSLFNSWKWLRSLDIVISSYLIVNRINLDSWMTLRQADFLLYLFVFYG